MSNAIIILYDITNQESFDDVQFWCNSIRKHCTHEPMIILVGNKSDEFQKRVISQKTASKYAKENKIHFAEVSSNDASSIEKLITYITTCVLDPGTKKEQTEEAEQKKEQISKDDELFSCVLT